MSKHRQERIYLSAPYQSGEEMQLLKEVLDSNWMAPAGPHLRQFEQLLEQAFAYPHVVAVNSGTAALHLILRKIGVTHGDKVLVSNLTFVGGVNPIRYLGAEPTFIDSELPTWNLCPDLLERYLSRNTDRLPKALVLAHLFGIPAAVTDIRDICNRYDVMLIEDCAESLGATMDGQALGTFGDYAFLSFNGNKTITTTGGGAVIAPDAKAAEEILYLATQARQPADHYDHSELGYNYRLSNLLAAIGIAQLRSIDFRLDRKRKIHGIYQYKLNSMGFQFLQESVAGSASYWLTCATLETDAITAKELVARLDSEYNIEARRIWKPMHLQPLYADSEQVLNGTSEQLFEKGICLPSGVGLTDEQLDFICNAVREIMG